VYILYLYSYLKDNPHLSPIPRVSATQSVYYITQSIILIKCSAKMHKMAETVYEVIDDTVKQPVFE